jgi:hypothetical protein
METGYFHFTTKAGDQQIIIFRPDSSTQDLGPFSSKFDVPKKTV